MRSGGIRKQTERVATVTPTVAGEARESATPAISYNVPSLGEGGDFYHKCKCGERMLNIVVNVERSTAPPLLPNVCYAFVLFI